MEKRRTFTAEFKLEAIKLALSPGNSIVQVASGLGVGKSALTHWIREYREKATMCLQVRAKLKGS